MKLLGKSIAVAALVVSAVNVAEARIQQVGDATADGSELVFNLVNFTDQSSYVLDLGTTIGQFFANPNQSYSFTINDANFASFAATYAAGDNVTWGVNGGHGVLNTEADLPIFGFYTTSLTATPSAIDANQGDISNTMTTWDEGLPIKFNSGGANSENLSYYRTVGQPGYTAGLGNDLLGALPFVAQGAVGSSLFFVHEKVNATDFDTGELEAFANTWKFVINGGVGTLSFASAATPAAVPLPAAVWMFGAGLMAMLRANRRQTLAA